MKANDRSDNFTLQRYRDNRQHFTKFATKLDQQFFPCDQHYSCDQLQHAHILNCGHTTWVIVLLCTGETSNLHFYGEKVRFINIGFF